MPDQPTFHPDPVFLILNVTKHNGRYWGKNPDTGKFYWAEEPRDFCMYGSESVAEGAIVDHKLDGVKISKAQVGLDADRSKIVCEPLTPVKVALDSLVACFACCQEERFDFAEGKPWVDFAPDIVHVFRVRFTMRVGGKMIDVTLTEAAEQPS